MTGCLWIVARKLLQDHHISFIEFISWFKKKRSAETRGMATVSDETLKECQEKFNLYDTNGNGTIDRDELAGLIRALDLEKYVPTVEELSGDPPTYTVTVFTSGEADSGMDAPAHLTLVGADATTSKLEFGKSFQRGSVITFKLQATDVGAPTLLKLGHNANRTWNVNQIDVTYAGGEPVTFGYKDWVNPKQTVELTPGEVRVTTHWQVCMRACVDRGPTAQLTPPCSVSQVERAKTSSKVATSVKVHYNPLLEAKEDDPDDANDSLGGPERKVSRHSHLGKSISLLLGLVRSADACILPVWTVNH